MPCVSYIANGFCKEPTEDDSGRGRSELCFWNPMPWDSTVRMTVCFPDDPRRQREMRLVMPRARP